MSSPGIDRWIAESPSSWAKLAKKGKGKQTFEQFKKKFFEGAEAENKGYLKKYIKNEQLKHIYENNGSTEKKIYSDPVPVKPVKVKLVVPRKGKSYERTNNPNWSHNLDFVLKKASEAKPKSKEYYMFRQIAIDSSGRTQQAVTKKIQRVRRDLNDKHKE